MIVITLISILAGAVTPSLQRQVQRSRDARRLADIRAVCTAIDNFYADKGRWPAADDSPSHGDWDVSYDGDFISELRATGYLPRTCATRSTTRRTTTATTCTPRARTAATARRPST
ncbi:MAG: hypothetical protein H6828_00475 [Planctomycetes bacterium]|nr:hypothetical protein [Planctomycetota bacterium]